MLRRFLGFLILFAMLCPNQTSAQTVSQGFVATEQLVVGGVLGSDPTIVAGLNALLADNLVNSPFLLEVTDLDDPTYTDDDNITLNAYGGYDVDSNPANDWSGSNLFVIDPSDYDPGPGLPVSSFPDGDIVGGLLTAGPGTIVISGIPLNGLTVSANFFPGPDPGTYEFQSTETEAFLTTSFLETQPAPPPFAGTLVDLLTAFSIFPDVDGDGDGTNESYSAVFTFAGITCQLYHSAAQSPAEDCDNGVDDDGDSLVDCDDPDCAVFCNPGGVQFRRGDVNSDGARNIADAIYLLGFLFSGGEEPSCMDAGDVNDDGAGNIADAIYLLGFLFSGGPDAPAPGDNCGLDPTDTDPLDCAVPTGGC